MREMDTRFPTTDTVFEYCVDPNQKGWLSWENKLSSTYRLVLPAFSAFHQHPVLMLIESALPWLPPLLMMVQSAVQQLLTFRIAGFHTLLFVRHLLPLSLCTCNLMLLLLTGFWLLQATS